MEERSIILQNGRGEQEGALLVIEQKEQVKLELSLENGRSWRVVSGDYFSALVELREQLAAEGWVPLLKGAQVNVYPSRMAFQMGLGRMAYVMEIGQPVERPIDIFDPGDPEKIGSAEEQRTFFERWKQHARGDKTEES